MTVYYNYSRELIGIGKGCVWFLYLECDGNREVLHFKSVDDLLDYLDDLKTKFETNYYSDLLDDLADNYQKLYVELIRLKYKLLKETTHEKENYISLY